MPGDLELEPGDMDFETGDWRLKVIRVGEALFKTCNWMCGVHLTVAGFLI